MNDQVVGFVLKQTDYKENSVILTVLTKEYGKIAFLARGIRKINSKTAGTVLPYTKVRFLFDYRHDRTMFRMKSTTVESLYKGIHMDLTASAAAGVLSEIADLMNYDEADPGLCEVTYDLLDQCLGMLEEGKRADIIVALFLSRMLDTAGIAPDVDECVVCGSKLVSSISLKEGGFLCSSCASERGESEYSVSSLRRFRLLCKASPQHYDLIDKSIEDCTGDCRMLIAFFQQYAGVQVRSFRFFENLFTLKENS